MGGFETWYPEAIPLGKIAEDMCSQSLYPCQSCPAQPGSTWHSKSSE